MKKIAFLLLSIIVLASCDYLDPRPIEDLTTEDLWSHAVYGEGILSHVYQNLDINYEIDLEYLTDNAVPSEPGTNRLATGGWTVENNSIGDWQEDYTNIRYVNLYLENARELPYNVSDTEKDSLLKLYRYGEAYYLRGWFEWKLLQTYGGMAEGSDVAMGFPIVTTSLKMSDDLDIPRGTYEECIQQIVDDCDEAINILPLDYTNRRDPIIGIANRGRGSGLAAYALKARAYLYAASPAFGNSNETSWARAAEAASDAIKVSGGLTDLDEYGNFNSESFDNIWMTTFVSSNAWERQFYPPSLFGSGSCNPSQNLADAFPASDGYPIEESGVYDETNPYENRDPRFKKFFFFNSDSLHDIGIETYTGGADAPGGLSLLGTRTGYYLKKHTSDVVSLQPGSSTTDFKFRTFLHRSELYLNFAEAVNEAYGPNDDRYGFSAVEALALVRKRGLGDITDNYLTEQAALGKDAFRELIKNERRIELCFEGHRFWDIRRWNDEMNHTIKGVEITENSGAYSYNYINIENHVFEDHMRYVPLPYDQTLIMTNLIQNTGW